MSAVEAVADPSVAAPRRGRSALAFVTGFIAVAGLSLATDQLMHVLDVYPPWGEPMRDVDDNALALAYRIIYTIAGAALTAWLAPRAPMRHALWLGAFGTVMGTLGAVATIPMDLGPAWYPIAIAVTALPCAWLGGMLVQRGRRD